MKRASSLATTTTTTPPLLAEEWRPRTAPRMAWDATLRIEPRRPPATITRAAARAQKNPPLTLTSRTKSRVGNDLGDQRRRGKSHGGAGAGAGARAAPRAPTLGT